MKFYCIVNDLNNIANIDSYNLLKKSAIKRGLEWVDIQSRIDDSAEYNAQQLESGSLLYRLSIDAQSSLFDRMLVNPGVTTFHKTTDGPFKSATWGRTMRIEKSGVPLIPTIYGPTHTNAARLKKFVNQLGGFPVILKANGGSHGASVMRLDSMPSLMSVLGFVASTTAHTFVLRKYIKNARHIRMVVIGDAVCDTIEYLPQDNDFRTNAVETPRVKRQHLPNLETLAVQATQSLDLEFGGVDLLIDETGAAYIAEVNFPCNFARNQLATDVDISGKMVDYLIAKSKKLA